MFLISLGDIRLPFVSTGLVDVKIELSNPEEDIHLGKHRYCRVLDGPSLQAQLIIPDSASDPLRKARLCTLILVNDVTVASSQSSMQFPTGGRQFVVFSDFWRAVLRRNAREVNVGKFGVTVRFQEGQVVLEPDEAENNAAASKPGTAPHATSAAKGALDLGSEAAAKPSNGSNSSNDNNNSSNSSSGVEAEGDGGGAQQGARTTGDASSSSLSSSAPNIQIDTGANRAEEGNTKSSSSGNAHHDNDDDDDDDDKPAVQRPPSAASRRSDKRSTRSDASKLSTSVIAQRPGDDGQELPGEAEAVDVAAGLPKSMFREDTKVLDPDEVARLVENFDSLTHAIRKAAEELQVERERQQRLERDLRRQQQMMDENNA